MLGSKSCTVFPYFELSVVSIHRTGRQSSSLRVITCINKLHASVHISIWMHEYVHTHSKSPELHLLDCDRA